MNEKKFICPKCSSEMRPGTFTGSDVDWEKEGEHPFLKKDGAKIKTYACVKCGFLESYVQR